MTVGQKLSFISLWKLNDWGLYNRRNEAILRELARRDSVERVLHVEHVTLTQLAHWIFKWVKSKDLLLRRAAACQIGKGLSLMPINTYIDDKYYIYSVVDLYAGHFAPLRKLSDYLKKLQYRVINRHFRKISNIIVIAYPPLGYLPEAIRSIRHDLLIGDLVDDDIERTRDVNEKKKRLENYKSVLENCRWIMATSPTLNQKYGTLANCAIDFLPNAVNMQEYSSAALPGLSKKKTRKVVGYVGAINSSMDTELLEYIVGRFPLTDFALIGFCREKQSEDIRRLSQAYDNFHFIGERNYLEIPRMISDFDVLISFKKVDYRTTGNNSLKIYEYLATGNPIVTTPVSPAEQFRDIVYVAYDKAQFAEFLKMALEEDRADLRQKRKEAAVRNSWTVRVDTILASISGLLNTGSGGAPNGQLPAKAGR